MNVKIKKTLDDNELSPCSPQCKIVSVIKPLFITTWIPRATATTIATPIKSEAPAKNSEIKSDSFIP